jgi:DNA-binding transcriptional LysR family regulator
VRPTRRQPDAATVARAGLVRPKRIGHHPSFVVAQKGLGVVLLARTTRSVSLTDAGKHPVESAGPAVRQTLAALTRCRRNRERRSVGFGSRCRARRLVITPVLPTFRASHPRIEVEVAFEDRLVDIVAERYDAGVRMSEAMERDMVQVRLTDPFRLVVVGAPGYLARYGTPERPQDLLRHESITFRSRTTGSLYAWELERGRGKWRVPVSAGVVIDDAQMHVSLAEQGVGLAYTFEPVAMEHRQQMSA